MYRIAILSFYSGVVDRGVETFAYEMACRLGKSYEVTVFSSGKIPTSIKFKNIQIKVKANIPKASGGLLGKFYFDWQSLKILLFTLRLIPYLFKNKFDVLIVLNGGWQTFISRIITKLTKTKMIIPGEAGIGSDDAWNLLFRPDVFVALTASQSKWAARLQSEVRIEIIPNGVDLSKFNPKISPAKISLAKPIAVCSSALVPYKRVDLTVKAIAKTKNLSLLVLGDGQMRGQIDSLGKRFLQNRYLRLSVPYQDMPAYYKAGDVFTLASETEAFGSSYIEAMACNLPVVTTSDDSREEIVGRAGILTNPENTSQYAKDLNIAASTNYRNIPYDQALKFSWNKVAARYQGLINELVKNK